VAPNSNASPVGLYLTIFPISQFTLRYHLSTKRQSTKFSFCSGLYARKALATSLESRRESDLDVARDWKSTSASLGLYEIDFGNRTDILPIPLLTTSQIFLHSDYKFDRLNLH